MSLTELLLAISLLNGTSPSELQDAALKASFPTFRFAVLRAALDNEILDPRETRYVLARAEDFPGDLQMLQRRYRELADAPALADAFRFPDRTVVNELLVFNRAYRNYVEMRQPMEMANWGELRTAQREVDYLYQVWDTVRDARCEYYYISVRRLALKRLREYIGEDSYYKAKLPPHIPIWRFREIE